MIHLRVTPDGRLTNDSVEQFAQSLCNYQSPLERWTGKGFARQPFVSFETVLKKNDTQFVLTGPVEAESLMRKAAESTWPRAAVESVKDPLQLSPMLTNTLSLRHHYMFAIRVDRREISYLSSLLDTLTMMDDNDSVVIQTLAIPANRDWYVSAAEAYDRFKRGDMPAKLQINKQGIGKAGLKVVAGTLLGGISILTELITGEEPEKINLDEGERAAILRDGRLRNETLQKVRGDAFDVTVRIAISCTDTGRAHALMRMVSMAFRELDGDNQLITVNSNPVRTWQQIKERRSPLKLQKDFLSIPESSRLFMLPTGSLQEKYRLQSIRSLETDIPKTIMRGGIRLGDHNYKGSNQTVYQPVDNHDELCLPHIVIGGMGSGKTKGFGANFAVQAVQNGFGALVIDPAKGEMGDEIEASLSRESVKRITLGEVAISLDWNEVKYSSRAKNRLANTIIGFFNTATDDAGAQTARYLRAAVMGMQTGKLSEIIKILEDDDYRLTVIEAMPCGMHKTTLESMSPERMSANRKQQLLSPIYNRLDVILGDEYLAECMDSDNELDMVDLMSQRKAIVIDVPKAVLGSEAVDLIVNLLSTKIDLAMTLRKAGDQFPFFVIFDEPHQFLRSEKIWKSGVVESRKWRLGYIWMFHSWEQIPNNLGEIIKAAGVHYHLYNSSKKTFRDLAEEIAPFTIEEGIKLPRFHAINVIRTGGEITVPFIAKMSPPPSINETANPTANQTVTKDGGGF